MRATGPGVRIRTFARQEPDAILASNVPSDTVMRAVSPSNGGAVPRRLAPSAGEVEAHVGGVKPAFDAENAPLVRERAAEHRPAARLDEGRTVDGDVHTRHRRGGGPEGQPLVVGRERLADEEREFKTLCRGASTACQHEDHYKGDAHDRHDLETHGY